MSLNTDIIKIQMVKEGYLPNYPPHMISDEEMCESFLPLDYPVTDAEWDAFLTDDKLSMLRDYYDIPRDSSGNIISSLATPYRILVSEMARIIKEYCNSIEDDKVLPDWILSYMNHSVISNASDYRDLDSLLTMLGINMIEPEFTADAYEKCYNISVEWLMKSANTSRPATMFGEPHIIKYLRLEQTNLPRKR